MKNNQQGFFSWNLSLSFFILMSLLTLNFGIPAHDGQSFESVELNSGFVHPEFGFEPISHVVGKLIHKEELQSENPEPVAQLNSSSIEDVLILLKNIQSELSALQNKTTEENQELKSQISDLHGKFLSQRNEIENLKPITADLLIDESWIKQRIEANQEEIQKKFDDLSKDLKSQMASLSKSNQIQQQQKEQSKSESGVKTEKIEKKEVPKQNQNGQNKPNKTINVNRNDQVRFPQYVPISTQPKKTSSALSAPQFYSFEDFWGSSYTPSSSEWKSKCVDLPFMFSGSTRSLKTGGHCLFICPEKNCKAANFGYFKAPCQTISTTTKEIKKLKDIGMDRKIKSFRQC